MDALAVADGTASRAVYVAKISGGTVGNIGKWIVAIHDAEWNEETIRNVDVGIFDTEQEAEGHRRAVVRMLSTVIEGVLRRERKKEPRCTTDA